jgi:hypothetical protein
VPPPKVNPVKNPKPETEEEDYENDFDDTNLLLEERPSKRNA